MVTKNHNQKCRKYYSSITLQNFEYINKNILKKVSHEEIYKIKMEVTINDFIGQK